MPTIWMEILGIIILVITFFCAVYLIFFSEMSHKKIKLFSAIGLIFGLIFLLSPRITGLKNPLLGEITTKANQVREDAEEVKILRHEVENQRDAIALVVRDANEARGDLDQLSDITQKANEKLESLQQTVAKAEQGLQLLNSITEFSLYIARATNDDRQAFDFLVEVVNSDGPFKALASRAVVEIAQNINLQVRLDADFRYENYDMEPDVAPLDVWHSVYQQVHSIYRPAFLSLFWQQERFSKKDRLNFLYDVIKSDTSLRAVYRACVLVNKEAKLDKNILGKDLYLQWWDQNKENYN